MQCPQCESECLIEAKFCSQCGAPLAAGSELEEFARLEAIDFSEDIERLTLGFTGRAALFARIEAWLNSGGDRFFLLTALPGLGKSAVAARLTQRLSGQILAHHFCIAGRNNTVVPGAALRSLSAQLAQNLPGYGLALANTIKPAQLRINVDIHVETLSGGQVAGVVIRNLKPTDPETELDILLRAPLAELEPPQAPSFILIDSLDEALTHRGHVNLVSLLSEVDDLPAWVRFFCTSRPERAVLSFFEGREPWELAADSDMNRQDLREFVHRRLEQPGFAEAREGSGTESVDLADAISQLAKGNFLYARVLLDDIAAGRQPLDDLSALPGDLDAIYHGFLKRFSTLEWERRYQPVLSVLAVSFQALDADQLANFTGLSRTVLRQALGVLTQFLTVTHGPDRSETFQLFHQSFREYLLSESRNRDFWCAPEDGHAGITAYYLRRWQGRWTDARDDGYLFLHLASHLDAQADRRPEAGAELEGLFESDEWRIARVASDGFVHQGYIADLDLARARAETAARDQIAGGRTLAALADCVHFALLRTGVNTLASGYQPALVRRALEFRLEDWSPQRALGVASRIPDAKDRLEMLDAVIASERLSAEQKVRADELIIEAVQQIDDQSARTRLLQKVAADLSAELLEPLLQAALALEHPIDRKNLVLLLLDRLPPRLYQLAVEETWGEPGELVRAGLLIRQARGESGESRHHKQRLALELIFSGRRSDRHDALHYFKALIKDLPPALLTKALETVTASKYSDRCRWLLALIPRLEGGERQRAIAEIEQVAGRSTMLDLVIERLRLGAFSSAEALCEQVLELIGQLRDESGREDALARLADVLPRELHPRFCDRLGALLKHDKPRIDVRLGLVKKQGEAADPALVSRLLAEIIPMQAEGYRADALVELAPWLSGPDLDTALDAALELESVHDLTRVAVALAPALDTGQVSRVIEAVRGIEYQGNQAEILAALAPRCDEVRFAEAVGIALDMDNPVARGNAMVGILKWAGDAWLERAMELAYSPEHGYGGAKSLLALASGCEDGALPRLLATVARQWPEGFDLAEAGAALRRLSPGDLDRVLRPVLEGAGDSKSEAEAHVVIAAFARWMPDDGLEALFQRARSLQDERYRALATRALYPRLSREQLELVLNELPDTASEDARAYALQGWPGQVVPGLRERVARESLAAARREGVLRASVVPGLLPNLFGEYAEQALADIRALPGKECAEVLQAWAPVMEESLLPAAFAAARETDADWTTVGALKALARRLTPESLPQQLALARGEREQGVLLLAAAEGGDARVMEFALRAILGFADEYNRAEALAELGSGLSPPQAERAFEAALPMTDHNKAAVLTALVSRLSADSLETASRFAVQAHDSGTLLKALLPRLRGEARAEAAQQLWYRGLLSGDVEAVALATPFLSAPFREDWQGRVRDVQADTAFEMAATATVLSGPDRQERFERAVDCALGHRDDALRTLAELVPLLEGDALDRALASMEQAGEPGQAATALAHVSRWLLPDRKADAIRSAVQAALYLDKAYHLSDAIGGIIAELDGEWPESLVNAGLLAEVLSRLLEDAESVRYAQRLEPVIDCLRSRGEPLPEVAEVLLDTLQEYQDRPRGQVIALLVSGLFAPGLLRIDGATVARIVATALDLDLAARPRASAAGDTG